MKPLVVVGGRLIFALLLIVGGVETVAWAAPAPELVQDGPERWDAAFFMPQSASSPIFGNFLGTSVIIPLDYMPDVRVTLLNGETKFDYGACSVHVEFGAAPSVGGPAVTLAANGTMHFAGFDRGDDQNTPRAKFTVTLDSLQPTLKAGKISINAGDVAAKLVTAGVLKFFAKYLSFSIPIPFDISGETAFEDDVPFVAKDGKVLVHVNAPKISVSKKLTDMQVVFVPSGLWLCAEYDGVKRPAPIGTESLQPKERWKMYEENGKKDTPIALVRGAFIESAISELGHLPTERSPLAARRIRAISLTVARLFGCTTMRNTAP